MCHTYIVTCPPQGVTELVARGIRLAEARMSDADTLVLVRDTVTPAEQYPRGAYAAAVVAAAFCANLHLASHDILMAARTVIDNLCWHASEDNPEQWRKNDRVREAKSEALRWRQHILADCDGRLTPFSYTLGLIKILGEEGNRAIIRLVPAGFTHAEADAVGLAKLTSRLYPNMQCATVLYNGEGVSVATIDATAIRVQ